MKIWAECGHKHKLIYIDKIKKFQGNEYTAFGTALHYVCENIVVDHSKVAEGKNLFQQKFLDELRELKSTGFELNGKMIQDMREQGNNIVEFVLPELSKYFGEYEVFSVEEKYSNNDVILHEGRYFLVQDSTKVDPTNLEHIVEN